MTIRQAKNNIMSNESTLKPVFIPAHVNTNIRRRKLLVAASVGASAVGTGFVAVPFLKSWLPSERAKAIGAPVIVDITKLEAGRLTNNIVAWKSCLYIENEKL